MNDFLYACIIGLLILFLFWLVILVFVYIRKPPKSKLTKKLTIQSLFIFGLGFLVMYILINIDSF